MRINRYEPLLGLGPNELEFSAVKGSCTLDEAILDSIQQKEALWLNVKCSKHSYHFTGKVLFHWRKKY